MGMPKTSLLMGAVMALSCLLVYAADAELQVVHRNCWIEIFGRRQLFYEDDPHPRSQRSKEFATVTNLAGKDWSNDFERVIVGSNAMVRAHEDKDFKGTGMAFAPRKRVAKLDMANKIESLKITCESS